jgi:hypothetical protein
MGGGFENFLLLLHFASRAGIYLPMSVIIRMRTFDFYTAQGLTAYIILNKLHILLRESRAWVVKAFSATAL